MKKVLIVEDDELLNAGICYNLQKENLIPIPVYSFTDACKMTGKEEYGLIILDIHLPDGNGLELCKKLRKHSNVPILFLTANDLEEDMIKAFQAGADDYVTKPFSVNILMERIKAILKRCGEGEAQIYECDGLHIDFTRKIVKSEEGVVALTPIEYQIIEIIVKNRSRIVTREDLLEKIWDSKGNYVSEHTLTSNISRLRQKINSGEIDYIQTIYGMGYQWMGDKIK
ncbi:MAG: response regulator transcription factor [Lachnoclostridium sp.]|nr:response regulator transcription factor [Lachnospira sp.]MCM1248378.1 response regulator transcription factor [Lachnoclostridium sp.]